MYSLPVISFMCSLPEHFNQYIMEMFLIVVFFKGTRLLKISLNKEVEEIKSEKS